MHSLPNATILDTAKAAAIAPPTFFAIEENAEPTEEAVPDAELCISAEEDFTFFAMLCTSFFTFPDVSELCVLTFEAVEALLLSICDHAFFIASLWLMPSDL